MRERPLALPLRSMLTIFESARFLPDWVRLSYSK